MTYCCSLFGCSRYFVGSSRLLSTLPWRSLSSTASIGVRLRESKLFFNCLLGCVGAVQLSYFSIIYLGVLELFNVVNNMTPPTL